MSLLSEIIHDRRIEAGRSVGGHVLRRIHDLGLTQTELADRSGVSRRRIGDIVKGSSIPRASTLAKIDSALS